MRVAALYDIHGNLPALQAVLNEIERSGIDRIVIGGDVLPGPLALESLEALDRLRIPVDWIRGNGDRECLEHFHGRETEWFRNAAESWRVPIRESVRRLTFHWADRIARWPGEITMTLPTLGSVTFCHAIPGNDAAIFTARTPESNLRTTFDRHSGTMVVCGHTHMPFQRMIGTTCVINAGSVGMPVGSHAASWLILGSTWEFRLTDYDLGRAEQMIRDSHDPQADEFIRLCLREPLTEEAMTAAYSRVEIGSGSDQ